MKIDHSAFVPQIPYIPFEKRQSLLPKYNVCSIFPSTDPADDFVTGNGFMRLQASGRPFDDEIAYTEETLYEPQWKETPLPPDLRPIMPKLRQLLLEGRHDEIDALLDEAQKAAGFEKYMNFNSKILYPVGGPRLHTALWLTFRRAEAKDIHDYLRFLELDTGRVSSLFTDARGTFRTDSFCACRQNIAVTRFTAPEGQLDLEVTVDLPGRPVAFGYLKLAQPFPGSTHRLTTTRDGFLLSWAYNPDFGHKGYAAAVRFIPEGGTVQADGHSWSLTGGTALTVLVKIVKFEEAYEHSLASGVWDDLLALDANVEDMLASNAKILGEKMDRSRICLCPEEDLYLSGEELLRRCHSQNSLDPALLEKMYDMGRFFQIYETGKLPPMMGQHNINTNLQVCAGNNTGLFDEMDVYFRYYETKFDDFRVNAQRLFGARGLLASVHCDPDSGLFYHFSRTYPHYCWTGCLGWIWNELWGHWLVTGDKEFLRSRVLPAYEEMALFYEDYACDRGPDGKVIFYPSFSPENPTPNPGYETVTCKDIHATRINSVMDIAICREILQNLIDGSRELEINAEKIPHWEEQLASLPTYLLDEEGGLKEWAWPTIEENYNHRHVSHHYDVWPGRAITPETEPELAEAILLSNRKRGQQDDSAHGIIHRVFTAIRLKDEEELFQNLSQLLGHGFVRPTLQTNHFPYRGFFPDLLGAVPAFLIEMAVFSMPGTVELLPAMPASLPEGTLKGIWLYTFAKLEEMRWDRGGVHAVLISSRAQTLTLRCRRPGARLLVDGQPVSMTGDHAEVSFTPDRPVTVEFLF